MIVRGGNRGSARGALGGLAVAALMLVVACETPMPRAVGPVEDATATGARAEVAAGVVSARDQKLHVMMEDLQKEGVAPLYVVDGKVVADISGIDPDHIVTPVQQDPGDVRTYKSGAAGDENLHAIQSI